MFMSGESDVLGQRFVFESTAQDVDAVAGDTPGIFDTLSVGLGIDRVVLMPMLGLLGGSVVALLSFPNGALAFATIGVWGWFINRWINRRAEISEAFRISSLLHAQEVNAEVDEDDARTIDYVNGRVRGMR